MLECRALRPLNTQMITRKVAMPNSNEYYEKHTAKLRDDLASGNIITIVGAGASLAATEGNPLGGWIGLLKHGIDL